MKFGDRRLNHPNSTKSLSSNLADLGVRLSPNFTPESPRSASGRLAVHVEIDQEIRRDGLRSELAKKIRDLPTVIRAVIDEMLHLTAKGILKHLAL